jgi:hypothetical protein
MISTAPMSDCAPDGRAVPIWSVVSVAPPLSASAPSSGSVHVRSFAPVRLHVLSLSKLWSLDVYVPEPPQSTPVLFAMIVFTNVVVPLPAVWMPPPDPAAELLATVLFVKFLVACELYNARLGPSPSPYSR